MNRATEIGLADLALALGILRPDPQAEDTRIAIAKLLGLHWLPDRQRAATDHGCPEGGADTRAAREQGRESSFIDDWPPVRGDDSVPITLEPITEPEPREVAEGWQALLGREEVPTPQNARHSRDAPPTSQPLFRPNWQRSILQAAASLAEASAEVDIAALVHASASRCAVHHLPRRTRHTLRHGVQLLLDGSRSMAACLADQRQLLRELRKLIPAERCEVLHFLESPARGVVAERGFKSASYQAPVRPRVVLVVSDFGAAPLRAEPQAATLAEWLAFAELLAAAECPLVALSPYDRQYWHPALAARADVITWDRNTNVAGVSRERRYNP